MPGLAIGIIICQKAPIREYPSTMAASSSSLGISAKNPRIIHTAKGRLNAVYAIIRPVFVLTRLNILSNENRGIMVTIGGKHPGRKHPERNLPGVWQKYPQGS